MDPDWTKLAHVFGALVFLGGSLTTARLLGLASGADEAARRATAGLARRAYLTVTFPAAVLLLVSGIYTLVVDPREVGYLKQGWFHAKLSVALLILVVDHVLVIRPLKALAKGTAGPASSPDLYRVGFWLIAVLAFVLCLALFVLRK